MVFKPFFKTVNKGKTCLKGTVLLGAFLPFFGHCTICEDILGLSYVETGMLQAFMSQHQ